MSAADYAPQPPTEDEKYLCYGRQGRWIFCVFLLAFAGVMFGLARLAGNSMWTSLLYSGRADVAALARRHRFVYLSRPDRGVLRKAGNLRYGFAHSRGDLIHVFDADFAPRPDVTRELAPYFGDPSIGIVQSPQFFDVQQDHFNWLQGSAGATREMFYRWIQPARDAVMDAGQLSRPRRGHPGAAPRARRRGLVPGQRRRPRPALLGPLRGGARQAAGGAGMAAVRACRRPRRPAPHLRPRLPVPAEPGRLPSPAGGSAVKRRAVRFDHQYWQGWSLGQLRAFVAEHRDVGDEALLLAVTETGTAPLRGIGFFSMPLRRNGGR